MKTLVTGGAGFIGSHLVDILLERGDEVVVLDNFRRPSVGHLRPRVDAGDVALIEGDIRDYDKVLDATEGVEVVYHLAAQSNVLGSLDDIDYSFTANVVGTFNVLKAAADKGVRRVVFTSSREVYGDPDDLPVAESHRMQAKNPYGASKVAGEAYCLAFQRMGHEVAILRLANIYGPHDCDRVIPIFLDRARRGEDLELYGGRQLIDFFSVHRTAEAIAAAAGCPLNGPINLGSGHGTTLPELAERVLEVTGSSSHIRFLPARELEVTGYVADVSRMRGVLGVEPPDDPLSDLESMV
ncbi:MAG: NAD-dependent epimerase/dehydratase family protein [Dehalococcoidia bacterium]